MRPESTILTGFCQCGCGTPVRQGIRFVRFHHLKLRTPTTVNPSMYTVDPVTGCWNWNGGIYQKGGYGRPPSKKGRMTAHCWVYEKLVGPIPDGLELDHTCRNRRCVNPDHLEPVTTVVNIRRIGRTSMTMERAREIRALRGVATCDELAMRFGVSRSLISLIQLGKVWAE